MTKPCPKCKKEPARKPGTNVLCESCWAVAKEAARIRNTAAVLRWQRAHPEQHNANVKRHRATAKYQSGAQARERKYQYGITQAQFLALVKKQGGCCAICGKACPVDAGHPQKRLCVDHNHTTKKLRGLLCRTCNLAVSALLDNPVLADATAVYLRKHA